jgi:hypothetical protein
MLLTDCANAALNANMCTAVAKACGASSHACQRVAFLINSPAIVPWSSILFFNLLRKKLKLAHTWNSAGTLSKIRFGSLMTSSDSCKSLLLPNLGSALPFESILSALTLSGYDTVAMPTL